MSSEAKHAVAADIASFLTDINKMDKQLTSKPAEGEIFEGGGNKEN